MNKTLILVVEDDTPKAAALWIAVIKCYLPAVRIYNRTAECQSKAKASASVAYFIFPGIEHLKHMLSGLFWNPGAVVLHRDPDIFLLFSGCREPTE